MRRRGRGQQRFRHSITDFWWLCCCCSSDTPIGARRSEGEGQDRTRHLAGPEPQHDLDARVPGRERDQSDPFVPSRRGIPAGRATCRRSSPSPASTPKTSSRSATGSGHQRLQVQPHERRAPGERQRPAHARLEGEVTFAFGSRTGSRRGGATYESRGVGSGSVHFLWRVTVDPDPGYGQRGGHGREADGTAQDREEAAARKEASRILKARAGRSARSSRPSRRGSRPRGQGGGGSGRRGPEEAGGGRGGSGRRGPEEAGGGRGGSGRRGRQRNRRRRARRGACRRWTRSSRPGGRPSRRWTK